MWCRFPHDDGGGGMSIDLQEALAWIAGLFEIQTVIALELDRPEGLPEGIDPDQ